MNELVICRKEDLEKIADCLREGESKLTLDQMMEESSNLIEQKESLVESLTEAGIEASSEETFSTLVPKAKDSLEGLGRYKKIYDELCAGRTDFSYLYYKRDAEITVPIDTSSGTNFSRMFNGSSITRVPNIDTSNGTDFSYMFDSAKKLYEFPQLNLSKGKNFQNMFGAMGSIEEIPDLDLSSGTTFASMFTGSTSNPVTMLKKVGDIKFGAGTGAGCFYNNLYQKGSSVGKLFTANLTNMNQFFRASTAWAGMGLVSIEQIDLSSSTNNTAMFEHRSALESITFVGTIQVSLSLSASPINVESAKSAINALVDYSGTDKEYAYTLSLSTTTLALLAEEGATAPGGVTWTEFAYNKGWNI